MSDFNKSALNSLSLRTMSFKPLYLHFIFTLMLMVWFVVPMDFSKTEIIKNDKVQLVNYDDGETIGNSTSILTETNGQTCLEYTLGSEAPYPFAGIEIKHQQYFNLEKRDLLKIKLEVSQKRRFHIFYGIKTPSGLVQKFMRSLDCHPNQTEYELKLKNFVTPTWWFKNNKVSEDNFNEIDLTKIQCFWIENDVWSERNKADSFCLQKFYATTDNFHPLLWFLGLTIGINGLFWGFNFLYESRRKIEYKPIEVDSINSEQVLEEEALLILDYISQNYHNPDLSLKSIRKQLKIPENKISKLIRTHLSISYKDHLHEIRITEAKRLLSETNCNINEVAFKVGFNGISTFNRVFKEKESKTPSEFLKKHK